MKTPLTPYTVFKRAVVISVVCVLLLTLTVSLTTYMLVSHTDSSEMKYCTSALILVRNGSPDFDSTGNNDGNSSSAGYESLLNTCATLFVTDPDMKSLISGAEVTIEPVEDTCFLRITSSSDDPHTTANIANLVANTAPSIFRKYFGDAGKVSKVDDANVPSQMTKVDSGMKYCASALILVQSGSSDYTIDTDSERRDETVHVSYDALRNTCATLLLVDPDMKSLIHGAEIKIEPVENTCFLKIISTSDDPHTAANIANIVADTAHSVSKKYFGDAGRVSKVSEAYVPSQKSKVDEDAMESKEVLHIVLIAGLGILSGAMILAIILIAFVYSSQEKYYAAYMQKNAIYPDPAR